MTVVDAGRRAGSTGWARRPRTADGNSALRGRSAPDHVGGIPSAVGTITGMTLTDTDPRVLEIRDARLREMSERQRAEILTGLTLSVQQLAFVGMRERYPQAADDEIWLRLAVSRLGPEMVRKAYGRVPGHS